MILLTCTLAWSLLTPSQGSDGNLVLQQDQLLGLYPKLLASEVITCECTSGCDTVYWFRTVPAAGQVQFLGRVNNADIVKHGTDVNKQRFELKRKSGSLSQLRIVNVTEEDAGVYACVLKDRRGREVWKSGILLLPGVTPPSPPPPTTATTKARVKSVCRCSPRGGCGSWVLWPLVGTVATLAAALLCTLYYFSRLPKKCRHRFVKKRLMT